MLTIETYIKKTPDKGLGLFSKNFVKKGTIVWEWIEGFDIEVHSSKFEQLNDVQKSYVTKYFSREGDFMYSSCDLSVFQNHSYDPNIAKLEENKWVAIKDIQPDEEILSDYSEFDDDFDLYKETFF